MKLKLIIAPILISVASFAPAASIVTSNNAGSDSSIIVDSNDVAIANGWAAIGYFTITDVAITTSTGAQLASGFQILGTSSGTNFEAGGGFTMAGVWDFSASASTPGGNEFVGKNAYLVIGNAATLGSSSEAFIYKTNTLFAADPSTPVTLDFSAGAPAGTTIFGATGVEVAGSFTDGSQTFPGNTVQTGYQTAVLVPEPSAALLGAIGALGLLRRRRI